MNDPGRSGFRGYIVSRPLRNVHYSQRLQNLVVRDFAARNGLRYLLSGTEHAMPHCYMILEGILRELPLLDGIIFFSAFALPASARRRSAIYERALAADTVLHFALENISMRSLEDAQRIEQLLACVALLGAVPFNGRYAKAVDEPFASHPTARALLACGEWTVARA